MRIITHLRRWCAAACAVLLGLILAVVPQHAASAASYVRLGGDGSSFAYPAISQWARDVHNRGINIDYNPDGSAAGRLNYVQNQADFAGTDIQFLTAPDPFGAGAESSAYAYSYIPVVAGGTAFLYNLKVGGRTISDLRLSGQTLANIFTGKIKNWADKAITHDYGAQLPSQPITVVSRSDGSGATYQFTRYLSKTYPSTWSAFCVKEHVRANCGPTEFYPSYAGSQQRSGSDQVANYVHTYEGTIAYDEYSYALSVRQPVVKVLNAAGYYAQPSASNVAIALQAAIIDENPNDVNFLIQNLDHVYTNHDPRTYPISSYSYLVVPRDSRANTSGPPPRFSTAKGTTLSTWMHYVLCSAQQTAGQLGYSPLPKNLVQGGFKQDAHIPGHLGEPNLDTLPGCNNPTYSDGVNHLIKGAPQPSPCDKVGSPLNCVVRNGKAASNGTQAAGTGNNRRGGINSGVTVPGGGSAGGGGGGSGGAGTAGAGGGTGGTTGSTGGTGPAAGGGGASASGIAKTDPLTGATNGGGANNGNPALAVPTSLTGNAGGSLLFGILTALELVGAIAIPSALGIWLYRRRKPTG